MLEDAAAIRKVVIACGYVDLRKGIDNIQLSSNGEHMLISYAINDDYNYSKNEYLMYEIEYDY